MTGYHKIIRKKNFELFRTFIVETNVLMLIRTHHTNELMSQYVLQTLSDHF